MISLRKISFGIKVIMLCPDNGKFLEEITSRYQANGNVVRLQAAAEIKEET